ncbi:MAG: substrate-binding domain-containing protein [Lentisphaerota bacterium]
MPKTINETKYFQAVGMIRSLINELPSGEFVPIASNLENEFKLSHGTVIYALKTLSAEGTIVRPWGRKRYIVADKIARVAARIAMIRPDYPSYDLDTITHKIYAIGKARNWKFEQFSFRSWEELDITAIAERVDGIILIPSSEILSQEFLHALQKPKRPVIILMEHVENKKILNVCADDFEVGQLAAKTLYDLGHRRVLFIKDQPSESTMEERRAGFLNAQQVLKMDMDDELFLDVQLQPFEDAQDQSYIALTELINTTKINFTAIFSASLSGAVATLRVMREHKIKVPEEMKILAFSGESKLTSYLCPALSSIEIDMEDYGQCTVSLLENALNGNINQECQKKLKPQLVTRETT